MWITFITLVTFLFFVFAVGLFSLFLDRKEFIWKSIYATISWSILFLLAYIFSEVLLKTFDSYLWNFVFVKNFQDLLTIKMELAVFIANNALIYIMLFYIYLVLKDYFFNNELFVMKFIIFNLIYITVFSFLFVRYDLFLSNWELLQKDILLHNIDIQIDYLIFFHDFYDDWTDFLKLNLIFYALIFIILNLKITTSNIIYFRMSVYVALFVFEMYFFGWIFFIDFFILFLINFLIIEIFIYFLLLLKCLQKIKIKQVSVKIQL